jgi:acyl-coenzyme A synthetase/AMP-(fatty) acid ligase
VWSGDTVRMDEEGYLYFIGRLDEMIKTSGYRVSPTEVEEVLFASGLVKDAVAVGVSHATLGHAIAVIVASLQDGQAPTEKLLEYCKQNLPNFMVPHHIEWRDDLPRSPNGKYDRPLLSAQMRDLLVRE